MIGELRHRITFLAPAATPDEGGGRSLVWQEAATVWARIESSGGAEILRAAEIVPAAQYRITIRARSDIATSMRILFGTKTFEIDAVYDADGEARALTIDCHETPA